MAFVAEPRILRANSRFMTATRGAFLSSFHVTPLPTSRVVPAAWKYSGEMLNIIASAAAVDGLRSVVSSVKTFESLQQAGCNGGMLTNPADATPGIAAIVSIMRFCI